MPGADKGAAGRDEPGNGILAAGRPKSVRPMGAAPTAGRGGTDGVSGVIAPSVREGEVPGRAGGIAPGRTPGISDGRMPPAGMLAGAAGRGAGATAGIDEAVERAGAGAVSRGASTSTSISSSNAAVGRTAEGRPGGGAAAAVRGVPAGRPEASLSFSTNVAESQGLTKLPSAPTWWPFASSYGCWADDRMKTGIARSAASALSAAHSS